MIICKDFNLLQRKSYVAIHVGWCHQPACVSCVPPYKDYIHGLPASTSRWMEESFLEQEIKSGSFFCYKNTHRETLTIEIIYTRAQITWWNWFGSQRLLCCVNYCRTDLWHRTRDLEWDLEHWTRFGFKRPEQRAPLLCFTVRNLLFHNWRLQQHLWLVCYSSFLPMNQVYWKLISQKNKNHLWSLSARRFSLNAS